MEMMDFFSKQELQLEGSCRRNENVFLQTAEEQSHHVAQLKIEKQSGRNKKESVTVEEYVKNFKWDSHKYPMDKSLKIIGAKIMNTQKTCDEKLKKIMDEQNDIRNKLALLQKKDSNSLLNKDLGDLIYEKKISSSLFINTHGSKIMTSVLVVVHKKSIEKFRQVYPNVLLDWYVADLDNWNKRTRANVEHQNQNIEEDANRNEIIEAEFNSLKRKHTQLMKLPGVIPDSEKFLGHEDDDGNQLWRVTCMTEQVNDFMRILKKSGFVSQRFDYDAEQYQTNKNLVSQLKADMRKCNDNVLKKS